MRQFTETKFMFTVGSDLRNFSMVVGELFYIHLRDTVLIWCPSGLLIGIICLGAEFFLYSCYHDRTHTKPV